MLLRNAGTAVYYAGSACTTVYYTAMLQCRAGSAVRCTDMQQAA